MEILETILVFAVNGAILAFVVWLLIDWRRRRKRFTRDESAKHAIVRWRYPIEEWQRFCSAEATRLVREGVPKMLLSFIVPAIAMIALMWFLYDPATTYMWDPRIAILPVVGGIAAILIAIVLWRAWDFLKLRGYDSEIAIGREGIYETYSRQGEVKLERKLLFGPEYDVAGAELRNDGGTRTLVLTLSGYRGATAEKRIPVPRGHEPQAERVVKSL